MLVRLFPQAPLSEIGDAQLYQNSANLWYNDYIYV